MCKRSTATNYHKKTPPSQTKPLARITRFTSLLVFNFEEAPTDDSEVEHPEAPAAIPPLRPSVLWLRGLEATGGAVMRPMLPVTGAAVTGVTTEADTTGTAAASAVVDIDVKPGASRKRRFHTKRYKKN